jgi:hypothetical protein
MIFIRLLTTTIFILSSVELAFAQGEYLYRGQSGVGASVDYASNDITVAYGGSLGFSYKGIFDINFSFATLENRLNGYSWVSGHSMSPSFTFYLAKQESGGKQPTIGLSCAYLFNSEEFWTMKSGPNNAVSVGILFAHQILHSDNVILQPMFGVSFVKGPAFAVVSIASIAVGGRFEGGQVLTLTPMVSFQSPSVVYGGSFVFVL